MAAPARHGAARPGSARLGTEGAGSGGAAPAAAGGAPAPRPGPQRCGAEPEPPARGTAPGPPPPLRHRDRDRDRAPLRAPRPDPDPDPDPLPSPAPRPRRAPGAPPLCRCRCRWRRGHARRGGAGPVPGGARGRVSAQRRGRRSPQAARPEAAMAAQAEYHRLEDYEEDSPPGEEELLVHVTEGLQDSWHHIKNLDNFFTKIYHFHQKNGFACMMLSDLFELVQFLFVVTFSTFLLCCVEYDVLFANRPLNHSQAPAPERSKVTLPDAILPAPQCAQRIRANGWVIFLLVMAAVFWLYRLVKVLCSLLSYWEIRAFYIKALNIPSREQQMCVHKKELTELDIYHRILRFKNYTVAMVNKSLLPVRFRLPLLGHVVFLTQGLKYNLELLLFWGPGSLFQNKWNLQPQYKRAGSRLELAQRLARTMVLLGLANLLLCPFVLVWQVLYAFFSYTEVIKREPGSLGARRWSLYGRHYLRHFNELNHELQARLSRGYKPATKYMNSFTSPLLTVLAKNVGFFAGSILAVLIVLTVYDEDVLTVQHILTAITLLGLVVTLARSFIPDEHMVWCPEQLLQRVLAHIHYMPDHWQGNASKSETRNEMAQLFQYKAVFILEELLSPILTPLILIFALPARALDIIDFFRNFTVEVVGVGDICSFAQLDIRNHGNPQWLSAGQTEASVYQQAENGKTELSLMHFAITNPRWQPPPQSELFLSHLKEKVQQDAAAAPPAQRILAEGPLGTSLLSDDSATAPDGLLASLLARPILSASGLVSRDRRFVQPCSTASAAASVLASLSSPLPGRARVPSADSPGCHSDRLLPEESLLLSESRLLSLSRSAVLAEVASAEMSLHAIYMHELHQQQQQGPAPLAVGLWVAAGAPKQPSVTAGSAARASQAQLREMPLGGWAEEDEEEEEEEEEQTTG
ncbi:autophagy-related protein 9B isoform X2 [Anser cygnoides]|uniref:autophagy-related protein 9B isoform X2 n=1 Tax=Anser cygnoides TaxID=8845 RepID=UPI0034D2960B